VIEDARLLERGRFKDVVVPLVAACDRFVGAWAALKKFTRERRPSQKALDATYHVANHENAKSRELTEDELERLGLDADTRLWFMDLYRLRRAAFYLAPTAVIDAVKKARERLQG
jgi:hypothetical protein